jgi:hypothetical protein
MLPARTGKNMCQRVLLSVVGSLALTSSLVWAAEENVNRPGHTYAKYEVDSPEACDRACDNEKRCVAWTYVRPGVEDEDARCNLKDHISAPVKDSCCISAVDLDHPATRKAKPKPQPKAEAKPKPQPKPKEDAPAVSAPPSPSRQPIW